VEAVLLAGSRPEAGKTRPPEPPEPPSGVSKPAPKPASPSGSAANLIPSAPPASPAPAIPQPAELPKAAEVPKTTEALTLNDSGRPLGLSEKKAEPMPAESTEPKELGRGLALHKSIQLKLRDGARTIGFTADMEKQLVTGSNEAADLVMRLEKVVIAVEIATSPNINHEFENVQKCLRNGFNRVAVIATGRKLLDGIAAAVQGGLDSAAAAKVSYHTPDEFLSELQRLSKTAEAAPPAPTLAKTGKVLGISVTRTFPNLSPEEQRLNQQTVHDIAQRVFKS
jgi:hypothetical protein